MVDPFDSLRKAQNMGVSKGEKRQMLFDFYQKVYTEKQKKGFSGEQIYAFAAKAVSTFLEQYEITEKDSK